MSRRKKNLTSFYTKKNTDLEIARETKRVRNRRPNNLTSFAPRKGALLPPPRRTFEDTKRETTARNNKLVNSLTEWEDEYDTDENAEEQELCIICFNNIRKEQSIWQCTNCYCHLFHLPCIRQWSEKSPDLSATLSKEAFPDRMKKWACPNCRFQFPANKKPKKYFCYCGRVENPPVDPWLKPHTCGKICGKAAIPRCGHSCVEQCHPGKCPPCPAQMKAFCYCKKREEVRRCCQRFYSCNSVCEKVLPCGKHKCERQCHEGNNHYYFAYIYSLLGPCPPCLKTSLQNCRCGKKQRQVKCTEIDFSCEQACGKVFPCGHHRCERVCHSGACDAKCPLSIGRTCFCGKKRLDVKCWEETKSCNGSCDRVLSCGHKCVERCHSGACPPCQLTSTRKCRCGSMTKTLACRSSFTCNKKCTQSRNCGKHDCRKKCCSGDCPTCDVQCNRWLNCRNHKCKLVCHAGTCEYCPLEIDVSCPCGKRKKRRPCGQYPQLTHLVMRTCLGKHKRGKLPCNSPEFIDCNLKCGNLLECGNHTCEDKCHVVTKRRSFVEEDGRKYIVVTNQVGEDCKDSCRPCYRVCGKSLRVCAKDHKCVMPCHPPWEKCKPCPQPIKYDCYCGAHVLEIPCHLTIDPKVLAKKKSCGNGCSRDLVGCPHYCKNICHPGECEPCSETVVLTCKCKNLSKEISCIEAQQARQGLKVSQSFVKLLDCDNSCDERRQQREQQRELARKQKQREREISMIEQHKAQNQKKKRRTEKYTSIKRDRERKEALKLLKKRTKTNFLSPNVIIGIVVALVAVILIGIVVLKPAVK